MATQTTLQLVTTLGVRLEDPEELKFTSVYKVKALNFAQTQVAQMLDSMFLSELQVAEQLAMTGTGVSTLLFSDLGDTLLNGAQSIVAVYNVTEGGWLTKTTLKEQRKTENTLLAGGKTNRLYYIFDETIYVDDGGADDDFLRVYYLKLPTDMVSGGGGQAPTINECIYDLMLRFAEAQLWRSDNQLERAQVSYDEAMEYIDVLNALAELRRPKGVGTKSSNREKVQR